MSRLPKFIIFLTSEEPLASLKYTKFDEVSRAYLHFSGTANDVSSLLVKFEVVPSQNPGGLVHIRSTHNGKFWVRNSAQGMAIVAEANEPDENLSRLSCTLFNFTFGPLNTVQLMHAQQNRFASYQTSGQSAFALTLAGGQTRFKYKDWDTLFFLPRDVAFKGDNRKYLKAFETDRRYFQFSVDEMDRYVGMEVSYRTADGLVAIMNKFYRKYWRATDLYVYGDADLGVNETLFWPEKDSNNTVVLRPFNTNRYLKRYTDARRVDFLAANANIKDKYAIFTVEEAALTMEDEALTVEEAALTVEDEAHTVEEAASE